MKINYPIRTDVEQLRNGVSHSLHNKLVDRVDGRVQHHFTPFVRRIRHNWSVISVRSVSLLRHLLNLQRKKSTVSRVNVAVIHIHRSSLTVSGEYIRCWWWTVGSTVLRGSKKGECMSGIPHTQRGYGNKFWRVAPENFWLTCQSINTCSCNKFTLINKQLATTRRTTNFMVSAFTLMLCTRMPPQNLASLWL